jgi:putative ABC transport system permease protein
MKIPLTYVARNLWTRRLTTLLTAAGLALVVFVFATVLMLGEGLRKTLVATGEYNNVVLIRRGSETEVQSSVEREQAYIAASHPAIATGQNGDPMVSKETVVLIALNKRGTDKPGNVVIRGVSPLALSLRPQLTLSTGRMFRPGSSEIIAGSAIAKRFAGTGIGETLRFGKREWTVVGVFNAGNSGFDSEIWGDADQLMQAFRRPSFSSVIVRVTESDLFEPFKKAVESDQRLTLEAKREQSFYADQSKALSTFISILGMTLSIVFSLAACRT